MRLYLIWILERPVRFMMTWLWYRIQYHMSSSGPNERFPEIDNRTLRRSSCF